ncbi:MAG: anaerobic ribonucleoside-triphosphate reductase activating protein [Oscillospiraceae bacterium]|nr:anaerobic ribonucleoside-triphosphate reductase activating protein [Oscillospiraceae bacterium]
MLIYGLQKLSLLDYPGKLAATVFTGGCNLRCPFCHNASLVTRFSGCKRISDEEVFSFLEKRKGLLDGVCITGGEPLMQEDLADFIIKVRAMGFLVKLDTNGAFPEMLNSLIRRSLLDYVAMDIKNSFEKYPATAGVPGLDTGPVIESIKLLLQGNVPYEFRTTLVKPLHTSDDLEKMGIAVKGAENYYLQSFVDSGDLVGFGKRAESVGFESFSASEMEHFRTILSKYVQNVQIRN